MQETEAVAKARHELEVCNACRYCEGFCAVFPAVELRREFSAGDISYLANLCHNCRGCYYACQYAPPHEWGINVPRSLALVRAESYAEYAWPPAFARAFQRNGVVLSLVLAASLALVLILVTALVSPTSLHGLWGMESGSFYRIVPLWVMQAVGLVTFLFSLFAMAMGARAFWRDTAPHPPVTPHALIRATWDVLTLRNLGGGGHGCNDNSERFSHTRRWLHQTMFVGFLLCFAATCSGFVLDTFLDSPAPYDFISVPVLLGTFGGIGLATGAAGLFAMKLIDDPGPAARSLLGADVALLLLLAMAALTGLALLGLRQTVAMGIALAVHLSFILALFLILPYSKMVHGVYRTAALLQAALESRGGTQA